MASLGCTIRFYYNGKEDSVSEETPGVIIDALAFSMKAEYLNIPEGYTFEGWYTTETFEEGTKVIGDYTVTQDTNFYAKVVPPATVASLLTNLADELRTLTNTTDKMGLSVMAGHVSDANTEVDEQSAVVDELLAALQGKSVPGAYETCTVTISNYRGGSFHIEYYTLQDGVPIMKSECSQNAYSNYSIDVIVGSHMVAGVCSLAPGTNPNTITGGIVRADSSTDYIQPAGTGGMCFLVTGDGSITFTTV